MGELLKVSEKAKGTKGQLKGKDSSGATKREAPEDDAPTLAELGITYNESAKAQELADLPQKA